MGLHDSCSTEVRHSRQGEGFGCEIEGEFPISIVDSVVEADQGSCDGGHGC